MNQSTIKLYETLLLINYNVFNDKYTIDQEKEKKEYLKELNLMLFDIELKEKNLKNLIRSSIMNYKRYIFNIQEA